MLFEAGTTVLSRIMLSGTVFSQSLWLNVAEVKSNTVNTNNDICNFNDRPQNLGGGNSWLNRLRVFFFMVTSLLKNEW